MKFELTPEEEELILKKRRDEGSKSEVRYLKEDLFYYADSYYPEYCYLTAADLEKETGKILKQFRSLFKKGTEFHSDWADCWRDPAENYEFDNRWARKFLSKEKVS